LVFWAKDFGSQKVLESIEYFVYCGDFKTHLWDGRFAQNPKGEFLEVPINCKLQITAKTMLPKEFHHFKLLGNL